MIIRSSLSSLLVLGLISFGAACQSTEGEKETEGQGVSNSESANEDEEAEDEDEEDDTDDVNADDSNEESSDDGEGDEGAAVLVPCDKEIVQKSEDAAGQPCLTTDAFMKSLKLSKAQVQRFKALAKKSVVAH